MAPPVRPLDSSTPSYTPLASGEPAAIFHSDAGPIVILGADNTVERADLSDRLPPALLKDLQAKGLASTPPPNAARKTVMLSNAPLSPAMRAAVDKTFQLMDEKLLAPGKVVVFAPEQPQLVVDLVHPKPIDPVEARHAFNRSLMAQGLKPLPDPNFKPTDFEKRIEAEHLDYRPVYDADTGDIAAYSRRSNFYWEKRDRAGSWLASGEKPLETPPIDPIDLIPVPGGPAAKGASVGLRGLLKLAIKDGAELAIKESAEVGAKDLAELGIKEAAEEGSHIGARAAGDVAGKVPVYNPSGAMANCPACVSGMMKSKLTKSLWDADRIMGEYGFIDRSKNFNIQKTLSYIERATEKTANPKVADFAGKAATPGHYAIIAGTPGQLVKGEGAHVVYGRVLDNGARYIFDPQLQKFTTHEALIKRFGGVRAFHFE